jgi:L-lactate utilization protein LutB
MAFIRPKKRGDKTYYYLVESRREGKKVRQRVLKYLGANLETARERVGEGGRRC